MGAWWITVPVVLPLIGAVAGFMSRRVSARFAVICAWGVLVAVAVLAWQVRTGGVRRYHVGGWGVPLGIDLYADGLSAAMLLMTAVVAAAVSVYAYGYFRHAKEREARRTAPRPWAGKYFWPVWMFLLAGLNALFLSADAFNLYVGLELLGLSAVALVALGGDAEALTAAMRYLFVSLLGSLSYLLGVGLLYGSYATLDLAVLGQVMSTAPASHAAMAFMILGLLLKTALFPLHFWLPPAHANAPTPVSALLSGLVVTVSFYLVLRLWFGAFAPLATMRAAQFIGTLGGAAILWGSIQALRAQRLKLLVAYSTVAQLGYLFLLFPLAHAGAAITAWSGGVYFAISHALAKAAMFLAAGTIMHSAGHDRLSILGGISQVPVSAFAFGLAGMSLMGLPPSGGFIAKWMLLNAAIVGGQWWWVVVIIAGGLLASAYVFRLLQQAVRPAPKAILPRYVPPAMEWTALILAAIAVLLGLTALPPLRLLTIGTGFSGQPLLETLP